MTRQNRKNLDLVLQKLGQSKVINVDGLRRHQEVDAWRVD
jgi:hypothetical protein